MNPILYGDVFNMLWASATSIGSSFSMSYKKNKLAQFKAIAIFRDKAGSLYDNVYPLGGKKIKYLS